MGRGCHPAAGATMGPARIPRYGLPHRRQRARARPAPLWSRRADPSRAVPPGRAGLTVLLGCWTRGLPTLSKQGAGSRRERIANGPQFTSVGPFIHLYGASEGPHGLRGHRFLAAADRSTSTQGGCTGSGPDRHRMSCPPRPPIRASKREGLKQCSLSSPTGSEGLARPSRRRRRGTPRTAECSRASRSGIRCRRGGRSPPRGPVPPPCGRPDPHASDPGRPPRASR
jgi:hypothetical protein